MRSSIHKERTALSLAATTSRRIGSLPGASPMPGAPKPAACRQSSRRPPQGPRAGHSGGAPPPRTASKNRKEAPPLGRFSHQIRPPWAVTMPRHIVRPRPIPTAVSDARWNLVNTRSSCPGGTPAPASATSTSTPPSTRRALISRGDGDGVYFNAFSMRLTRTCSMSVASKGASAASGAIRTWTGRAPSLIL